MPADMSRPTPPPALVPQSQYWRMRARECRMAASRSQLDFAREHFLKAADDFERNALDTAEREIAGGISQLGRLMHDLHRE
jgi:hypothetical protein